MRLWTDNAIGPEGAVALAGNLGKLLHLQRLNLCRSFVLCYGGRIRVVCMAAGNERACAAVPGRAALWLHRVLLRCAVRLTDG